MVREERRGEVGTERNDVGYMENSTETPVADIMGIPNTCTVCVCVNKRDDDWS